jgi:succinoglycan biosynthesis transport protein ExoP
MDIREFITPIIKWWWFILLATVVAGGSSFLATRQQPLRYQSTATLTVGSPIDDLNPTSGDLFLTQELAGFYVDMANRSNVRQDVMEALEMTWLPEIYVVNVDNIIDIVVVDTVPERAQAVAAELTRQLIMRSPSAQQRDLERQEFIDRQLGIYQTGIMDAQAEIASKQEEVLNLTSAREIASMQAEIGELEASLYDLEQNYTLLLSSTQQGATNSISIIEPATLPNWPIPNNSNTTVIMAAGVGAVLAITAAFVLELLDNSIRTTEKLNKVTGLPVLAGIAELKEEDLKLVTLSKPLSPTAEAYRMIRTAIQFSGIQDDTEVTNILVISATPGEGKSTTASNLAVVLAQAGYKVLLVDGDLRRPTQHQIFGLSNKRGLTSMLLQMGMDSTDEEISEILTDTLQSTQAERLQLLACGPIPPNPAELLGSMKMKRVLSIADKNFDFVLIDSPPLLSVSEGLILSRRVDGVVLVARATTNKSQIKQAAEKLREINANVIGAVLNSVKSRDEGYRTLQYYREPYESDIVDQLIEEPEAEEGDESHANGKAQGRLLSGRSISLF